MTSLSTVLEGEARLRRRSAFVRCSLRITAITLGGLGGWGGTFVTSFP